jgi:hypothetical protein
MLAAWNCKVCAIWRMDTTVTTDRLPTREEELLEAVGKIARAVATEEDVAQDTLSQLAYDAPCR